MKILKYVIITIIILIVLIVGYFVIETNYNEKIRLEAENKWELEYEEFMSTAMNYSGNQSGVNVKEFIKFYKNTIVDIFNSENSNIEYLDDENLLSLKSYTFNYESKSYTLFYNSELEDINKFKKMLNEALDSIDENLQYNINIEEENEQITITEEYFYVPQQKNISGKRKGTYIKNLINNCIDFYNSTEKNKVADNLTIKYSFPSFYLYTPIQDSNFYEEQSVNFNKYAKSNEYIEDLEKLSSALEDEHIYNILTNVEKEYTHENYTFYINYEENDTKNHLIGNAEEKEKEKKSFVDQFKEYEGTISGNKVKDLVNLCVSYYNNNYNNNYYYNYTIPKIELIISEFTGKKYSALDSNESNSGVEELLKAVNESKNYEVSFIYDGSGWISNISILLQDEEEDKYTESTITDVRRFYDLIDKMCPNSTTGEVSGEEVRKFVEIGKEEFNKANEKSCRIYLPRIELTSKNGVKKETELIKETNNYSEYSTQYIQNCDKILNIINNKSNYSVKSNSAGIDSETTIIIIEE